MGFFSRVKGWLHPNLEPPPESEREKAAKRLRDKCANELACAMSERQRTHINERIDTVSKHLNDAIAEGKP